MLKLSPLFGSLALALGLSATLFAQDTTPPVAAIVTPADGSYVNSLLSLSGTAFDDVAVSSVQLRIIRQADGYSWDGAAFIGSENWLAAAYAGPGWTYSNVPAWVIGSTYTITAKAMDSSSNWSADYSTSAFVYLGPAALVPAGLSGVGVSGLTAGWGSTFPPGTVYYAELSTAPFPNAFSGNRSSATLALSAAFSGLDANTSYYAQVSTSLAGPFTGLGAALTLIENPSAVYFDAVSSHSIVASAYAQALTGLDRGLSGAVVALGGTYAAWRGGNSWTAKALMPTGRTGAGVAELGGKIYVVGGTGGPSPYLASNEVYDPLSDTWTPKAPMPTARQNFALVAAGGKLYAIGGCTSDDGLECVGFTGVNEEYDPAADSWTVRAPMPTARAQLMGAGAGDKIYVIGGTHDPVWFAAVLGTNEEYDPAADSWTVRAPMPTARRAAGVTSFGGKIYVMGGSLTDFVYTLTQNEAYDPAADSWAALAALPTSRRPALAAAGGKIYALGGYPNEALPDAKRNEEYDSASNTWAAMAALPADRSWFSAAAVNGKIYIAGDGPAPLNTVEEYDPGADSLFSGLTPNTLYPFKAKARNAAGIETAESPVFSTYTLAAAPAVPALVAAGTSSVTLNWLAGGNPAGTLYRAQLSTSPAFASTVSSSDTYLTGAVFQGLAANTSYYARAAARNNSGLWTDFTVLGSTSIYLQLDSVPPTQAVLQPADNAFLNALPRLSGTAADNVSVSSVAVSIQRNDTGLYWAGGSWVPGPAEVSASLWPSSWTYASVPAWTDGSSYTVVAKAADTSANWAVVYSTALFTYDVTPPSAAITGPVTGAYAAFSALSGTAADAHGVTQVEVSVRRESDLQYWTGSGWAAGPLWNAAAGTTAWTYTGITSAELASGATWLFNVRARDSAGNISEPALASSTFTYILPAEGVLSPGAFSGLGASSLTANWGTDFSAGTTYYVRLATQAAASPYLYAGSSLAASLLFPGLTPDSFYYGFVSTSPVSGFVASGSGRTLAEAPASAAFTGVGYSSASLSWAAGGNPAWTVYEYELSGSASFAALTASSSGPVTGGLFAGLAEGTTYYGRVRAVNGDGAATEYVYAPPAVTQAQLPSGLAAGLTGAALGADSIAWAWNSGTLSAADRYALYSGPGVLLATAPFAVSASYTQTGLGPNSAHVLRVAGGNGNGEGPLAVSAAVYTLAQAPSEPAAAQVELTSAAITLGLNGNPPGTALQLWRSADNVSFTSLYEGAALSYADDSLSECSAYYYKARARNGAGFYSGFSGTLSFTTLASTPAAPGGLYAEAQDGARIMLAWEPSPSASVSGYSLYYDSASGAVDYASPLAVFSSGAASWTTPALAAGATYKFALRADGACGTQEKNTSMLASAQAVGVLSGVRAAIKVPQTGKRIKGNMVTIVAETILGLPSQAAQVRFQYSPAGAGAWTDIPAASFSNPNPDLSAPYFVHWDADAMAAGAYDLRAVATDVYGAADPAAPSVTVVIDPANYDISESVTGGQQSKEQKINNAVTSTVQAADDATTLVTKIVIPSGAVADSTAAVTLVNNPSFVPAPPPGADPLSLAVKINLSNGQSRLSGGQSAALSFTYKDDDNNGIVDGTLAAVDRLRVYSVSDSGGAWVQLATSVDKEKKTVSAATTHFSFFSVFAAAASGLGSVKVYPVPWQPGTGGRFDSAEGVTFSGLPAAARIKIFTPTGELVRLLEVAAADAGFKVWDGRNSEGHKAASGIYLAVVRSGSDERTLKVAVER